MDTTEQNHFPRKRPCPALSCGENVRRVEGALLLHGGEGGGGEVCRATPPPPPAPPPSARPGQQALRTPAISSQLPPTPWLGFNPDDRPGGLPLASQLLLKASGDSGVGEAQESIWRLSRRAPVRVRSPVLQPLGGPRPGSESCGLQAPRGTGHCRPHPV